VKGFRKSNASGLGRFLRLDGRDVRTVAIEVVMQNE